MSKQQVILTIKFVVPVLSDYMLPGLGLGVGALIFLYDFCKSKPPSP